MVRPTAFFLESLENRELPAAFGLPWADGQHITLSFVPDGTNVDGVSSALFSNMIRGSTYNWQAAVLRAVQAWAGTAAINVGVVPDSGAPIGTPGAYQGDPRFGDIRVAARPLSANVLAITEPPGYLGGTQAGDIILNSNDTFSTNGSANSYDLFSVMVHELGHAFGLGDNDDPNSVMDGDYAVHTGLSAGDVGGIQALYGYRAPDAYESNNTAATAFPLTRPAGAPANASIVAIGDISNPGEGDYYSIQTPASNPNGLTVQLNTGWSMLAPKLTVFDSNGNVVGSTQSANPQTGVLTVSLANVLPYAGYTIKVEAANATFGVGGYQLRVVQDPSAPDASAAGSAAVLTGASVGHTLTGATGLLTAAGYADDTHYSVAANLSAGDAHYFTFHTPTAGPNEQIVLTVNVRAALPANLAPVAYLFDSSGQPVAAQTLVNGGSGTFALLLNNAASNQDYYVEVVAGNSGGNGNYQLDIDARPQVNALQSLAADSLSSSNPVDYLGLTVNRSQVMYFSLSAGAVPAGVQAGVRMAIFDSNGHAVSTLFARAGQTVSASVYLDAGNYTIRFEDLAPSGASLSPLTYTLQGATLTDPISLSPTDGSSDPVDYTISANTMLVSVTYDSLGNVVWQ